MPGLARKIVICAAVDGLVLHPLNSRKDQQQRLTPVRIKYGDASISHAAAADPSSSSSQPSFEAFGIIGTSLFHPTPNSLTLTTAPILCTVHKTTTNTLPLCRAGVHAGLVKVFRASYLISVTRRQQVALIRGLPVYVVTEVALTPCASLAEAAAAVAATGASLKVASATAGDELVGGEESGDETGGEMVPGEGGNGGSGEVLSEGEDGVGMPVGERRRSVAQDVIGRKGSYGRFAQRWFSRSGWAMEQKRTMGLSVEGGVPDKGVPPVGAELEDADGSAAAISLLPKLLRTSQILFGSSKTFYFAYDLDITRSMANPRTPETPLVPLHEHVEPAYFWNRNIMQPFIDAGADCLALPLMQGFVGQRTFVVDSHPPQVDEGANKDSVELNDLAPSRAASPSPPEKLTADMRPTEKKFDMTIISRRSVKRAGLRYLRRGIDEDGNVANSVESEQLLSPADAAWDPAAKVYSFVQTRGSVPLFFTQTPYSLKPVPVLRHSADANFAALKKHFDGLRARYGDVQVVNLVEKHGVEAPIGELYEQTIKRLIEESGAEADRVGFEWFDFHAVCRGMKFENVSFLLQILGSRLDSFGSSVSVNDHVITRQKGVLRTNCMDCLDRTNVCQSSFAKHMLDMQLKDQGFDMGAQKDQENAWFNTLWADNGDAISKQYASTGAMKGDYTRTRKRNYRGALTDAGLSVTRLFNG